MTLEDIRAAVREELRAEALRRMEPERKAFSPEQAAKALSVSLSTVRRLVSTGELAVVHLGKRRVVIPLSEIERVLSVNRRPAKLPGNRPPLINPREAIRALVKKGRH